MEFNGRQGAGLGGALGGGRGGAGGGGAGGASSIGKTPLTLKVSLFFFPFLLLYA